MKRLFLTFVLCLVAVLCHAHRVIVEGENYVVTHEWSYQGRQWSASFYVPQKLYQYYQHRHHQSDKMVEYVLSDHDRPLVASLVKAFSHCSKMADYSDHDNLGNVISFVQSLTYVKDKESKGVKDYVRFPVETLVDGVGDCEDLAIFAAAILHAMGYPVLLVSLPDHLALGVACDEECTGTSYEYQGKHYYYLEVTGKGWELGQVPNEFKGFRANLIPLEYWPTVRLKHCTYHSFSYYSDDPNVPFEVHCELENIGPGPTMGLGIRVVCSQYGVMTVFDKEFSLDELDEGQSSEVEFGFRVPRPFQGTMEVSVVGANVKPESLTFEEVSLK